MKKLLSLSLLLACTTAFAQQKKQAAKAPCGNEEHAMALLQKLPEVKARDRFIDSLTQHKHGIAMINYDQDNTSALSYYEINVGYSSEIRFESYYTFRVFKNDCHIEVEDIEDGWISLAEWRKRQQ
ncbi:hypothetical protein [Taibaiella koreensis]|uniref:hypothetical protein n=1 Tax=Taibaiella koreensis TaxID=1268548 RepID=UPI000E59BC8E|nr:hypothetical protein [Taibaiella koreensis]